MACRLKNTGVKALRIDLANGELLYLPGFETSPPMREELLYGNVYLAGWERLGLIERLPARMSEVAAAESGARTAGAAAGAAAAPAAGPKAAPTVKRITKSAPRKTR